MNTVDVVTTGGVAGDATAVELQSTTASPTAYGPRTATRADQAATATHQQRKNAE
jgi:hypothetical protein